MIPRTSLNWRTLDLGPKRDKLWSSSLGGDCSKAISILRKSYPSLPHACHGRPSTSSTAFTCCSGSSTSATAKSGRWRRGEAAELFSSSRKKGTEQFRNSSGTVPTAIDFALSFVSTLILGKHVKAAARCLAASFGCSVPSHCLLHLPQACYRSLSHSDILPSPRPPQSLCPLGH